MQVEEPPAAEPPGTEDRAALELRRSGDVQAFEPIVKKYMRAAYASALRLVGNHDDALDLSQEAFIRAHRAVAQFDVRRQFFTWYYQILRNLCLNHLRGQARRRHHQGEGMDTDGIEAIADTGANPAVLAERNEMTERLWRALAGLKPEDREIIGLREMEGCSYAELAERLEIPQGTVMSRLYHARRHLKQQLDRIE